MQLAPARVPRCHTWKVFQVKVTWNDLQQAHQSKWALGRTHRAAKNKCIITKSRTEHKGITYPPTPSLCKGNPGLCNRLCSVIFSLLFIFHCSLLIEQKHMVHFHCSLLIEQEHMLYFHCSLLLVQKHMLHFHYSLSLEVCQIFVAHCSPSLEITNSFVPIVLFFCSPIIVVISLFRNPLF